MKRIHMCDHCAKSIAHYKSTVRVRELIDIEIARGGRRVNSLTASLDRMTPAGWRNTVECCGVRVALDGSVSRGAGA